MIRFYLPLFRPLLLSLSVFQNILIYVYIGEKDTLPFFKLLVTHEQNLTQVLKEYKSEIGCKIVDIKWVSTTIFMHLLLIEEESKQKREL